ncbi:MAG: DNA polymerase III subunit delta [Hyphomicrobiales bacterium]|nr:DNA polymerase III subunit delta [Hyphomicrobiales bacterium]
MKLSAGRIEAFVKSPDERVHAILVFGPEPGLIHERVEYLMAAVVGVPADPFRLSTLSAQQIKTDPACLVDEAMSLSLLGGRRVIRVRDATDTLSDPFARVLQLQQPSALIIADAGDLPKRSRLRRLFEDAAAGAAIPCYQDTDATLRQVIEDSLAGDGHRISREAADLLVSHLGANRAVTRGELAKLSVYKGSPGEIGLDDVLAVVSDSSAISLGGIAYTACSGDFRALDRALDTAFAEGLQPVSILRTVAQHVSRLLTPTRRSKPDGRRSRPCKP